MPDKQTSELAVKVVFAGTFNDIDVPGVRVNDWLIDLAPRVGADARKVDLGYRTPGDEYDLRHPADKRSPPEGYMVQVWASSGIAGQATVMHSTISGQFVLTILEYSENFESAHA